MSEINEIKKASEVLKTSINATFDRLLLTLGGEEAIGSPTELVYSLAADTNAFIGTKPSAVLFGDERVEVKTWRGVYEVILKRCNADPQFHENLMYLRNKTAGKVRVFLSDKPDGMIRPCRIDVDMYGETHYGSATMLHILCKRILDYAGFDYRDIKIVLKS